MIKLLKWLLLPLSPLYAGVMALRNLFYRSGIFKTVHFSTPFIISVGNLTVGGTGKTPHVEYLVTLFSGKKTAILSRGYGRKTSGTIIADEKATACQMGDEPMQYLSKFGGKVPVCVSEDRVNGAKALKERFTDLDIILLDDAYQHRKIGRHLNILLSDFQKPFFTDFVLPAGRLREARAGATRADAVVFTKCPTALSASDQQRYIQKAKRYTNAPVFFSTFVYGEPVTISGEQAHEKNVVITGIANPKPMLQYLASRYKVADHLEYTDHHRYTQAEVDNWKSQFSDHLILTTEKDAVKLRELDLNGLHIAYLPVQVRFFGAEFDKFALSKHDAHFKG